MPHSLLLGRVLGLHPAVDGVSQWPWFTNVDLEHMVSMFSAWERLKMESHVRVKGVY